MMTLFSSCPLSLVFVKFNDPALEAIVKEKLGLRLTPVTSVDMLGLFSLDISGVGINDLTGLEYALSMTFFDASTNPISDLRALKTCISLRTLNLEDTEVFEISALESLTRLELVDLCGNAVNDLQPLIDNTGFNTDDTLTVDCVLVSGPSFDAQTTALAASGVTVFFCDCPPPPMTP